MQNTTSTQKSVTFLYTNNGHAKTKIKNKISFKIVPQETKHLGIMKPYILRWFENDSWFELGMHHRLSMNTTSWTHNVELNYKTIQKTKMLLAY